MNRPRYVAFADLSGGRADDAGLAIAHREERTVVVDLLRRYKPPFNPTDVIGRMCEEVRRFKVRRVTGDNYAAEFCKGAFEQQGIGYSKSDKPKAALYLELLPRLCSGEIELLDDKVLVNSSHHWNAARGRGGKDIIDHPQGGHDDLANVVAGVAVEASKRMMLAGAF